MKTYMALVTEALETLDELSPWDLEKSQSNNGNKLLFLDLRQPQEFHIPGSISVPRGVLKQSSESGFKEPNEELNNARKGRKIGIDQAALHFRSIRCNTLSLLHRTPSPPAMFDAGKV